jgi:hypothetical protein
MLNTFLLRELHRHKVNMQQISFQQGVTAHTARASMQVVRDMFPQHVISRFGDIHWPLHSPDIRMRLFVGLAQIKGVHKQPPQNPGTERFHSSGNR